MVIDVGLRSYLAERQHYHEIGCEGVYESEDSRLIATQVTVQQASAIMPPADVSHVG